MLREKLNAFLERLLAETERYYGERLISLVVFGSVGRGTPRFDSDIDILIVASRLSPRRLQRMEEFAIIEQALTPDLAELEKYGIYTSLSPVIKSREEVRRGSPLFLDMLEDGIILYDKEGFFRSFLDEFAQKLHRLGARRIKRGNAWYWVLKEPYQKNEVFEL